MLHKLEDPSRYWAVLKWFGKELFRFGHWLWIPIPLLMVGVFIMLKGKIPREASPAIRASAPSLGVDSWGLFFHLPDYAPMTFTGTCVFPSTAC